MEQEDLCFNFGKKRMIRLPKQIQEDQLYTCQSLGKGTLPRLETSEAWEDFLRKAEVEQFIFDTVRQKKIKDETRESFDTGVLPYQYRTTFNGTLYNIYDDLHFKTYIGLAEVSVNWLKKNNITSPRAIVHDAENNDYWSIWSLTSKLEATCIIDVPLHIFIW